MKIVVALLLSVVGCVLLMPNKPATPTAPTIGRILRDGAGWRITRDDTDEPLSIPDAVRTELMRDPRPDDSITIWYGDDGREELITLHRRGAPARKVYERP